MYVIALPNACGSFSFDGRSGHSPLMYSPLECTRIVTRRGLPSSTRAVCTTAMPLPVRASRQASHTLFKSAYFDLKYGLLASFGAGFRVACTFTRAALILAMLSLCRFTLHPPLRG